MTNTQSGGSNLVVVDGSNIATEGRSIPSLAQLNEAVLSLTSEFPDITVTVVVDATFGHRIDKSEVAEFDEAVAHNELVTPPAGAIGRGDAFVLSIANKVGARIFSNDSFQEFHGVYPWLFDEGRLIGGKPVPHVGWVFVNRVPVKGPLSRKARGAGRDGGAAVRTASKMASLPMPVPTSPPPGRATAKSVEIVKALDSPSPARGGRRRRLPVETPDAIPATGREATPLTVAASPVSGGPVNDLLPFLDFVEHHPVGGSVTGVVESYSSHGAYVKFGEVLGYVPLRLMGSPPPRSAREVMRVGERVTLVVASFAPGRRSIDLAVPGVGDVAPVPEREHPPARRGRKAVAPESAAAPDAEPATAALRTAEQLQPAPRARRGRTSVVAEPAEAALASAGVEVADVDTAPLAPRRRRAAAQRSVPAAVESASPPEPAAETPKKKPSRKPAAVANAVAVDDAVAVADRVQPAPAAASPPAKRSRAKLPVEAASEREDAVVPARRARPKKAAGPAEGAASASPVKAPRSKPSPPQRDRPKKATSADPAGMVAAKQARGAGAARSSRRRPPSTATE